MAEKKDIDEFSGTETTGHTWDGLKELNSPLPRWWLWLFYITIIGSVIYWLLFPSWPLVTSYTKGFLGTSQRQVALTAHEAILQARAEKGKLLVDASLEDIRSNQNLLDFSIASGRSAFGDNCAPCHGTGATGFTGYPNLQDDIWIWGGTLEDIHQTIRAGIRSDHDDTRTGEMTAFGRDEVLEKDEIEAVTDYVMSIGGLSPAEGADLEKGREIFADNCASCHGDEGKGNQELGAPDLTDGDWLFGSSRAAILATITNGRASVMPAWEGRLDDVTIKSLAVYVHTLGGGK